MIRAGRTARHAAVVATLLLAGCSQPEAPDEARVTVAADAPRAGARAAHATARVAVSLSNPACLSYGAWRETLTSAGPSYPLPVFAVEVERRCVVAYQDIRIDIITILPAGILPEKTEKPPVLGGVPDAGGLNDGRAPGSIEISAVTSLGGQANADALLGQIAGPPVIKPGSPSGIEATQRGITVAGDMSRNDLRAAMATLDGQWRPIRTDARGNARLEGLGVAANWHKVADGRHVWTEVGALDRGDEPDVRVLQWDKRGTAVIAYVHVLESDNIACYSGVLDARGKLTGLRFVDPIFGGDDGKPAVQSVEDSYPDHFAERAIRPASAVARGKIKALGGKGGPDICRQAFAHPEKIGMPDA